MICVESVKIGDIDCLAAKIDLPATPPLLVIIAEKGFVMCGFLNMEAAERLGAAAAMVSGVKTFEDVLNAEVKAVTTNARKLGVNVGMNGAEALKHLT
ncbi:MAG: DUF1805 domain-containing protein [Candidatus Bathyarchaeota archaeon]|jgi:uncharacterized protein YunC (DUF1805 family)|nr:DUF1805 domain-containing protein [Candidatus Bathyarchaeota archaeon]